MNLKKNIIKVNNNKILFTAGPASLLHENLSSIKPCFGRGDKEYLSVEKFVLKPIIELLTGSVP